MTESNNVRALTLADIFLMVLEQIAQDEEKKVYIRQGTDFDGRTRMRRIFELLCDKCNGDSDSNCSKYRYKAIDRLIHFYEDSIEENPQISPEQKKTQKVLMRESMSEYRMTVKNFIASRNLLKLE